LRSAALSLDVLQQALGNASPEPNAVYLELARVEMDRQLQEHALQDGGLVVSTERVDCQPDERPTRCRISHSNGPLRNSRSSAQ
jgi:hypothetical protein